MEFYFANQTLLLGLLLDRLVTDHMLHSYNYLIGFCYSLLMVISLEPGLQCIWNYFTVTDHLHFP